jgi:hypothetical protein
MRKRSLFNIVVVILTLAILLAIFVPAIDKTQQGAHVVQQMASFKEVYAHCNDHNEPPVLIFNKEIQYDPNAFGHPEKVLFHKEYFSHKVVTYGDGCFVLSNRKGKVLSEGETFIKDNKNKDNQPLQ